MTAATDFIVADAQGGPVPLDRYAGQVLLIVNTASKCGFTPQYEGLEALYRRFADRGFAVLGFPCNQFGAQEPGDAADIARFCSLTYDVTFPVFAKVDVNGAGADPLFLRLKAEAPGLLGSKAIKWNFTKFLVDRAGKVVRRYAPATKPEQIAADIAALL
ncbi:glutathione peroxidase [Sphingomonas insulae]|uniref:Glutathione peroxidase n=1 Tax=Sphingomonas insulae TaxID=424800 RepID=A0ABN1HRP5_9SPHN|nr:glutathione peroxidase [Sphingomonas insulae]NIJ29139.1 glutathione peroxidase [Sphingomonas insulae]